MYVVVAAVTVALSHGMRSARARYENLAVAPIGTGGRERSIDMWAVQSYCCWPACYR